MAETVPSGGFNVSGISISIHSRNVVVRLSEIAPDQPVAHTAIKTVDEVGLSNCITSIAKPLASFLEGKAIEPGLVNSIHHRDVCLDLQDL